MEHMDRTATTLAGIVLTKKFVTIVMGPVLMDATLVTQGIRVLRVSILYYRIFLLNIIQCGHGHLFVKNMFEYSSFKVCSEGWYGFDCNETCGNCYDQSECHPVNGTCSNGCNDGFLGKLCKTCMYLYSCTRIISEIMPVNRRKEQLEMFTSLS